MKLTPLQRLLIVVSMQVLILLSLVGFREYTLLTRDTVMLIALSADTSASAEDVVYYEISGIDLDDIAGENELWDEAFVELEEGADGYWHAVAIHGGHDSEFDDTVLIKGKLIDGYAGPHSAADIEYGIEHVDVGDTDPADVPWDEATISVKVKVDRYGEAEAEAGLYVDGDPLGAQGD
jgi:hypothetical protein